jgi:hypothetical protein
MGRDGTRAAIGRWVTTTLGLGLALTLAGVAGAQPMYLVDTGPGSAIGGLSLSTTGFLAGQFTLDQSYEINALEGWIIYPTVTGQLPVYAVLYGDDAGLPDLSDEIHAQLFQVPASGVPLSADWYGVSGLAIPVEAGIYWLAFEVPTADFGSGAMPPTPLQELDLYAVDSGAGYTSNTTAKIGIRVVPEPGAGAMLVGGTVGLTLVGRARARHVRGG